ncbi:MAG: LytTR family transcriptional regulator [Bacteroidales bacterium]|nr:LytTR family transcriptional regulator [Bacteroidales bacterium]
MCWPPTLFNPVFIAGVLTLLMLGDEPIRFVSDRRPVLLLPEEILYIESNDKEVTVFATEGRRFRNRTGISQWESILGKGFVRIHRSYLVNRVCITSVGADSLCAAGTELPISRKYRKTL